MGDFVAGVLAIDVIGDKVTLGGGAVALVGDRSGDGEFVALFGLDRRPGEVADHEVGAGVGNVDHERVAGGCSAIIEHGEGGRVLSRPLVGVLGGAVLEHAVFEVDVWMIGVLKATSALPFDIGVYLVVVGLVLMAYEAFGEDVVADADLDSVEVSP